MSDRFRVHIEPTELDSLRATLSFSNRSQAVAEWIDGLTRRLDEGIGSGTYTVIPVPARKSPGEPENIAQQSHVSCLRSLLTFTPEEGDVIWSDDRYVNGYSNRDGIPIIGISEVLKSLVSTGGISAGKYYELLSKLRAANARFLPLEAGEILFHLRQAKVVDGAVVETRNLSVLRRYVAACLLAASTLQQPNAKDGHRHNDEGEIAFLLTLNRAIAAAAAMVWNTGENETSCRARTEWLLTGLFLDHLGLLTLASLPQHERDDRYPLAVSLAGLISEAATLRSEGDKTSQSLRRRYLDWIGSRVLQVRFEADPLLRASVADLLKQLLESMRESIARQEQEQAAMRLIHDLFEDLPEAIRDELGRDADFMSGIGFRHTVNLGDLRFDPTTYWRAIREVVNGREAALIALESQMTIRLQPYRGKDQPAGFEFAHPKTGEMQIIVDPAFELLTESSLELEQVLRRNRDWTDCSDDALEAFIATIASIADPERRIEETRRWRDESAAVYYGELFSHLSEEGHFQFDDLIPRNAAGLLRHYRLDADTEGQRFEVRLVELAHALVREIGLLGAMERLMRLPVPMPPFIFDAAKELSSQELRSIVKALVQRSGSPVSQVHLAALLFNASNRAPVYRRLALRVLRDLAGPKGAVRYQAFSSILSWVNAKFALWPDAKLWPAPIRLAMTWAHAHQVYATLTKISTPPEWLQLAFGQASQHLLVGLFERDVDYELDIAHPKRLSREALFLLVRAHDIANNS